MPQPAQNRVLLGILFMMLAASIFPVMNGLVQVLSARYPSEQVIWSRTAGHLLIVLAVLLPRHGPRIVATRRPWLQSARSLLLAASTTFFFFAVKHVPLAKAAAVSFSGPFIVVLLAWPMLGERPRLTRIVSVLVAFLGVLVVIRPGTETFQPASLLVLGSATCYALYQILTRLVAGEDRPETSVIWSALLGSVLFTLLLPAVWVAPAGIVDAALLCCLGLLGAAGHYCVARAMTYAAASVVSPFQYWQIVGSVLMGWAITGLWPDGWTWLGAGIIVGAGVWMALVERRRQGG
jgi:drug/metabolite transporter (DMT)-like permease